MLYEVITVHAASPLLGGPFLEGLPFHRLTLARGLFHEGPDLQGKAEEVDEALRVVVVV